MNRREISSACLVGMVASLALLPMGCKKAPPITLSANANPPAVFPGEPVTVTATPGSVDPNKKNNVLYSWSGTGASGNGTSTTIQTGSLDPGNYSVKAEVKEGKKGKEGLKPGQTAEATASFTVKPFEPPTISCSVNPTTLKPGDAATVTSTGMSPQNRPLTYSYSATGGTISGSGTSANYASAGAPTGAVGITCTVADDKGHTATANTSLTIVAPPPPPPPPHTSTLCSINFSTDKRRPTRVSNEAKACLDEVALDLQRQADAKVVIVGEANAKESAQTAKQEAYAAKHKRAKVMRFAAQRAVNAKDYLTTEKGIDGSRISVATGTADAQAAENYLVPAGATFAGDVQGTTPVEESTVKPEARKPLGHR
jgi:outer membrane protein OmpA-like peptidoglycan-associated protein